jgi:hypothetical protein
MSDHNDIITVNDVRPKIAVFVLSAQLRFRKQRLEEAVRLTMAAVIHKLVCVSRQRGSAAARNLSTSSSLITFKQHDKVGIITLNAPGKMNALSVAMGDELAGVLQSLDFEKVGANDAYIDWFG